MSGPVYKVGDPAPPPLPRRSEAEVMARWQGDKPVVSIRCATYQHVDFIEDALRGFLGQDTEFPFEILVRDDASTDGTAEIVRDYSERYPNIIRAVLETENRWPDVTPLQVLGPMVRGEFIAVCEGDDYWIDNSKLQRQVQELRQSAWAIACHHDSVVIASEKVLLRHELPRNRRRNLEGLDAHKTAYLPVRALLYRRELSGAPRPLGVNGDVALTQSVALWGGSVYIGRVMAVYRRHPNSWRSTRAGKRTPPEHARSIAHFLAERKRPEASAYWRRKVTFRAIRARKWSQIAVRDIPLACIEALFRRAQQGLRTLR